MKALILAGGFGTRLRPLTLKTPKELLPIVGKEAIHYLLENLEKTDITKAYFSVNQVYAEQIRNYVNSRQSKIHFEFLIEPAQDEAGKLGAVGALDHVRSVIDLQDDYLILGADNFAPNFDFANFIEDFKKSGAVATIALYELPDLDKVSQFGVAVVDESGRITELKEKPKKLEEIKSNLVCTAYYAVKPQFFSAVSNYVKETIAAGQKPDNLGELFEWLIAKDVYIHGHIFSGFWADIGNLTGYLAGNHFLLKLNDIHQIHGEASVHPTATVEAPTIIEAGVKIEEGAKIEGHTQIMKGAMVGKNATVKASILFPGAEIAENAIVEQAVVDEGAKAEGSVKGTIVGREDKPPDQQ